MISIARRVLRLGLIGLLVCPVAYADVPATLNYQGTLTDGAGQPINGDKTITLRLYTVPTGGTPFWVGQQTLAVKDGRFSVVLGGNPTNPLDPKLFTGETYIGTQVTPDAEMPRQKLASVAYAFKAADAIPKGVIVMWSGGADAIPAGWALCDGANGTPDLRDRFIVGAGGDYPVSTQGGVVSHVIDHSHTIPADAPETNWAGEHQHSYSGSTSVMRGEGHSVDDTNRNDREVAGDGHYHDYSGSTNVTGGHSHTVNSHSHSGATGTWTKSLDNRPPYYALAFIIKL